MPNFIKSTDIYSNNKIDCPERKLFIAVLSQAVHDAFAKHVPPYEKSQAQAWLMSNSYDFKIICEHSGRESKYVLGKIRKKILRDNGWNVDVSLRITTPRRRSQMKAINKKHLSGNSYYAVKRQTRRNDEERRTDRHTI